MHWRCPPVARARARAPAPRTRMRSRSRPRRTRRRCPGRTPPAAGPRGHAGPRRLPHRGRGGGAPSRLRRSPGPRGSNRRGRNSDCASWERAFIGYAGTEGAGEGAECYGRVPARGKLDPQKKRGAHPGLAWPTRAPREGYELRFALQRYLHRDIEPPAKRVVRRRRRAQRVVARGRIARDEERHRSFPDPNPGGCRCRPRTSYFVADPPASEEIEVVVRGQVELIGRRARRPLQAREVLPAQTHRVRSLRVPERGERLPVEECPAAVGRALALGERSSRNGEIWKLSR